MWVLHPSSAVNLNADLGVVLCVLVQALLTAFRTRLGPGFATATPTPPSDASWTPPEPSPPTATP